LDDPERIGIHESHLGFYYNKYYKKQLNTKFYGAETTAALLELVKDTVGIDASNGVMKSELKEEGIDKLDIFVKLTEEHRRDRQQKLDNGDESARLSFPCSP